MSDKEVFKFLSVVFLPAFAVIGFYYLMLYITS
jgi:hypothetical protein